MRANRATTLLAMRANASIPSATVIPVLVYPDVRAAVAWLTEAFGLASEFGSAGHRWQFTQTTRDVAPEEWGGSTIDR